MAPTSPLLDHPVVRADLERVEDRLREVVRADDDFLTEVASHLIEAGGKRARPLFALAAASTSRPAIEPADDDVVAGGVAVELVHLGSLYHDDVMDDATTRRTVESVNAKWGNLQAILAGDYLLARASEIAAGLGTEVAALLAATIARLCEGQVRELRSTYDLERDEAAYFASIDGKTAALFATACRIGAITAGHDRERIEALTDFGRSYGMAFQIVDDVLDVTATDAQLGKPAGHDLVEGVYTLPVIRALTAGDAAAASLRGLLGGPLDEAQKDQAREAVRSSGQVDGAILTAEDWVDRAAMALAPFEDGEATEALAVQAHALLDGVRAIAESAA